MATLFWRRCTGCGQLMLVPLATAPCRQCGTPMAALPTDSSFPRLPRDPRNADRRLVAPLGGLGYGDEALAIAAPVPVLVEPASAEEAGVLRLLASVFPDGIPL